MSVLRESDRQLASRIAADPTGGERAIEPRKHLSHSQLNTFASCGEKYRLKYVVGAPQEASGAMFGGIAIHETIEESERLDWWREERDPDPFLTAESEGILYFRAKLDDLIRERGGLERIKWGGKGQGEDYPWWLKNGEFMLRRYVATRRAWDGIGWRTVEGGTEMKVTERFDGVRIPITGYLDKFLFREVDLETGEVGPEPAIVDWKTGKVGGVQPMQFATYAALLEIGPGVKTTLGFAVFLRAPEAERRVQQVHFAPIVPRMHEVYANLLASIESGRYSPNPMAWCSSCEVRESCWYWTGTQPPKEPE